MLRQRLITVLYLTTLFSVAMGYLESAVVIYLREIYYPAGFTFPINPLSGKIAVTEVFREIATILMLLSVGFIAGSNLRQRFAVFIFCFAVWDIFYYVFLKILIQWPESFFTWDILFLIPLTWTGPVITPLIVSGTMILLACVLLFYENKGPLPHNSWLYRAIFISGAALVFLSFIWDFSRYMLNHFEVNGLFRADRINLAMQQYIPQSFNWCLFITGELVLLAGIYLIYAGSFKSSNP